MRSIAFRWTIVLAACFAAGCGSSSGLESGIPDNAPEVPVNPTPDMDPDPVKPGKGRRTGAVERPGQPWDQFSVERAV